MTLKKYNEYLNNDKDSKLDVKEHIEIIEKNFPNCSMLERIWEHPSYNKIIENGNESLSFLFEHIKSGNGFMFWIKALEDITNIKTPVLNSNGVKKFWLDWASEHGY